MNKIYLIQPYAVGKDKKSLAMVLPSDVVKALEINPQAIFLSLKVVGADCLYLQIIRQSDLERKDVDHIPPLIKECHPHQQVSSIDVRKKEEEKK